MKIKNKSNKVVGIPAFRIDGKKVVREKGNIPLLPGNIMEIPDEMKDDIAIAISAGFISVAKKTASKEETATDPNGKGVDGGEQ